MTLSEIFDTRTCSRCGGSGHYSYCEMHGTTCFGCSGTGRQWAKKDQPLVNDFVEAQRKAQHPCAQHLIAGDIIADDRPGKRYTDSKGRSCRPWVEVASVEKTDRVIGRGSRGVKGKPGYEETVSYAYRVTLADGYVYEPGHILRRKATMARILSLCKLPATVQKVNAAQARQAAVKEPVAA